MPDIFIVGNACSLLVALEVHTNRFTLERLDCLVAVEDTGDFLKLVERGSAWFTSE